MFLGKYKDGAYMGLVNVPGNDAAAYGELNRQVGEAIRGGYSFPEAGDGYTLQRMASLSGRTASEMLSDMKRGIL